MMRPRVEEEGREAECVADRHLQQEEELCICILVRLRFEIFLSVVEAYCIVFGHFERGVWVGLLELSTWQQHSNTLYNSQPYFFWTRW